MEFIISKYNYWSFIILMMIGLYALLTKKNLIKKVIALTIFQTAIILFYISTAVKTDSSIPIIKHSHHEYETNINPDDYANPLPQVLMLTAIVVGVSTLGVALSLIQKIHREYGTIEEDEIAEILNE